MVHCYERDLTECGVHFQFLDRVRLIRIMMSLQGVQRVLCSNKSIGVQEIVQSSTCIESARRYGSCDQDTLGVEGNIFFARMMRFQVGSEGCQPLSDFKNCLHKNMILGKCDNIAMDYVIRALDAWIYNFCTRGGVDVTNFALGYTTINHYLFMMFSFIAFFLNFSNHVQRILF